MTPGTVIGDLSGARFGKLVAIERTHTTRSAGEYFWRCVCDCGGQAVVRARDLRTLHTKSCGCLTKKHGHSQTRLYSTWRSMLRRCENPKDSAYENYGARGITVCAEWHSLSDFRRWALSTGYTDSLTIERADNSLGYCPENCSWIPLVAQAANRRGVHKNAQGELWSHIAARNGISGTLFRVRLSSGWSVEAAATTPVRRRTKPAALYLQGSL